VAELKTRTTEKHTAPEKNHCLPAIAVTMESERKCSAMEILPVESVPARKEWHELL
jgi:hypothetical protein